MDTDDLKDIRRWSAAMTQVCAIGALLFVVGAGWRAATMTPPALALWLDIPQVVLTDGRRIGLAVALIVPAAINAYGLLRLSASFRRIARGEVFSPRAIRGLQTFSGAAMVSVGVAAAMTPALGMWLTYDNPAGLDVPVTIGSGSVTLLLISGVTWIFARILTIAAALHVRNDELTQENEAFI